MSLIAFAVRICAVKALLGQTLAGTVEDAPIDPVAVAMTSTTPYIAVFTDTENNKPDASSMIEGDHVQDLMLHVFLPAELKVAINGVTYDFQARESGAALVIDLIYRQIEGVLMKSQSVWARLWRQFVVSFVEIDSRAYVLQTGTGTGVRVPAREIVMRCNTLFSPPFGAVPEGPWADLVAALAADPDTQGLDALLAGMITGELLPQWRQDETELGVTELASLGLGPAHFQSDQQDQSASEVPVQEIDLIDRSQPDQPFTVTAP